MPPIDSINEPAFPIAAYAVSPAKPSEIECQVMDLFERFAPSAPLRIVVRFIRARWGGDRPGSVSVAVPPFSGGKSRRNLRGWIFRVAHNLALKQRCSNQRCAARRRRMDDRGKAVLPVAQP